MSRNAFIIIAAIVIPLTLIESCSLSDPLDPANAAAFMEPPRVTQIYSASAALSFRLSGTAEVFYAAVPSGSAAPTYNDIARGTLGSTLASRGCYYFASGSSTGGALLPGGGNFDIYLTARSIGGHSAVFSRMQQVSVTVTGGTPQSILQWGSAGTGEGQFNAPAGIAVDAWNFVYVTDTVNNNVQKFTADGIFVKRWGTTGSQHGQFNSPIAAAAYGAFVFILERNNCRIQKFNSNGDFILACCSYGSGPGQLDDPRGFCISPDGFIYVVDFANSRVQKLTADGIFVMQWGTSGSGDGEFDEPYSAYATASEVYISDPNNGRIQVFTANGVFLRSWAGIGSAYAVSGDNAGRIFVTQENDNNAVKFTATGTTLATWALSSPYGIACDALGNIYIAESGAKRVRKFR